MKNFLGVADSCSKVTNEDRSLLGQLVLAARGANAFLESAPTNLEDILSFAEMARRLGLDAEAESKAKQLKHIIRKIFTVVDNPADYLARFRAFEGFLGQRHPTYDLEIITTNYDLNAEMAVHSLAATTRLGFKFNQEQTAGYSVSSELYSPDGGIPLHKLHGSVNWFEHDREISVESGIATVMNLRGRSESMIPISCFHNYQCDEAPLLVPPTFLKADLNDALRTSWAGAASALSRSTHVVFVGYSFPRSDTEMMYFLATALSKNHALRGIHLIDKAAHRIAERLRDGGSRLGSHFRELLVPHQMEWENARLASIT